MRYLSLLSLLFIFACKQEKIIVLVEKSIVEDTILSTDTLKLSLDSDLVENDWVLIHLIEKNYTKDSNLNAKYRFDFYRNGELENNFSVNVDFLEEGSDWYGNPLFYDFKKPKYCPYFIITNGFPACGYTQTNFLIDVRKESFQLIDTFFSVGDGGWYTSTIFKEIGTSKLGARQENYWQEEDDNDDIGTLTFSDSVNYVLKNKKWIKKYITPKDTIYKKQKISFDVMIKMQE